jgi:hypothetical protein
MSGNYTPKIKTGWLVIASPIIFVESQERRNLTLVKRRRRRRDFYPSIEIL